MHAVGRSVGQSSRGGRGMFTKIILHYLRKIRRSISASLERLASILFRPKAFASRIEIGSSKNFIRATRFYVECCIYSSLAWVFLIYVLGAKGIHDTLFPVSPELARMLYATLGLVWTSVTGLIMFVGLRGLYPYKINIASFFHCFAYASGAVLILMVLLACIGAFFILRVDVTAAQTGKLTLLEMAGVPFL